MEDINVELQRLRADERLDDLQLCGLRIIQNTKLFRFGTDAVLLANFAKAGKNEAVLDLCTGTGIIPLLMSAKTGARHFTGLEIQAESACMARRSVRLNALTDRIKIDTGDLKTAAQLYGAAAFDVITVNPPYLNAGETNEKHELALARHEIACTLDDVLSSSAKVLKHGGRLYMVHRPHRLADVVAGMRKRNLEPKRLRMVHPSASKPASLFLIEAALYGNTWMDIMPPLDLERDSGIENVF